MRANHDLDEQPNHGHYSACLGRKAEIDSGCRKTFFYTVFASAVFIVLTIYTLRIAVISWLPAMLGESTEVGPYFLQIFLILCLLLVAALGCSKYKIFHVLLFLIYALMVFVAAVFHPYGISDVISLVIGAGGAATTFRSYSAFMDYRQLEQTEGFPHFNERYTNQVENGSYSSTYRYSYDDFSNEMDNTVPAAPIAPSPSVSFDDSSPEMPELIPVKGFFDNKKIYLPESDKHFALSDSQIRTKQDV